VADVEIGRGKTGRGAYTLDEIGIVPARRTRDPEEVSIAWQIDAYRFDLPLMACPMDSVVSPATAIQIGRLGGLAVLDLEGLWTRYEDPEPLLAEVTELVDGLRASRSGVVWIAEMLPKREVIQLLTHATVFAIPSIYEPLGIVNLEAMACGTAVVGSRTGGIPEVVADGETGLLVPAGEPEPLAAALNTLLSDPDRAAAMGQAGRKRAVAEFGWAAIAAQTADLYAELAH